MTSIELVQAIMADLNKLSLTSVRDWEIGVGIAKALITLKHGLEDEEKARRKAQEDAIAEARAKRQFEKQAAAEKGEEILGGETIRINSDGSQEVIIP